MSEPRWIRFELARSLTKTHVWNVIATESGAVIGRIRWHAPWRRYVFTPDLGVATVLDAECLLELKIFIETKMRQHKAARAARREAGEA